MLKIVVLGYGELAQSILLGVLHSRHSLIGAMRYHKHFLKDLFMPDGLLTLIKANNIKELKARKANTKAFIKEMKKLKPDVIIVGSWGEIIKEEIIKLPRVAFINCHPSLLPKHRGSNPYASVIKHGETETGVTYHLMRKDIDAGEILLQEKVNIDNNETASSLRRKCALEARDMVRKLLDGLEKGEIIPKKQNPEEASYYPQLNDDDVKIDWHKPAYLIERQLRAIFPNMYCYTIHKNTFLTTKSAQMVNLKKPVMIPGIVLNKNAEEILVSTGDQNTAILLKDIGIYGLPFKFCTGFYLNRHLKIGDLLS